MVRLVFLVFRLSHYLYGNPFFSKREILAESPRYVRGSFVGYVDSKSHNVSIFPHAWKMEFAYSFHKTRYFKIPFGPSLLYSV